MPGSFWRCRGRAGFTSSLWRRCAMGVLRLPWNAVPAAGDGVSTALMRPGRSSMRGPCAGRRRAVSPGPCMVVTWGDSPRDQMVIVCGVWLVLAGALALLAGHSGRARVRRLRRRGLTTWGVTVAPPSEEERHADRPRRTLVQYRLADGHVLEQIVPAAGLGR